MEKGYPFPGCRHNLTYLNIMEKGEIAYSYQYIYTNDNCCEDVYCRVVVCGKGL